MRMNIRRMAQGDRKHHKRSKRLNKVLIIMIIRVEFQNIYLPSHHYFIKCRMDRSKITFRSQNSNKMDPPSNLQMVRNFLNSHLEKN